MRDWIRRLASMRLAVVLLVCIVVALASGTIVESLRGAETAARFVYGAAWFHVLLGLFTLNVACSLIERWPWGRHRAGFALTHLSLIVILAGAAITQGWRVEGKLALWEGEESAAFVAVAGRADAGAARNLPLPFAVRLEAFEIDHYPGTRRPAMFRSRVTVRDPTSGASFPAVIEMNCELSHGGYRLYQSGYQLGPERDQTILLVSRDPGQPIVFAGFGLLLAGMVTVLATRIAQRRPAAGEVPRRRARVAAALAALALAGVPAARADLVLTPEALSALRRLPVQHDGRVMPLDTLAREATWKVTGTRRWGGSDPVELVLGWVFEPQRAASRPLVVVGDAELVRALGLAEGTRHAAFFELASNGRLMSLLRRARAAQPQEPLPALLHAARELEERLLWMQGFLQGHALAVVPDAKDPAAPWSPPERLETPEDLLALARSQAGSAPMPSSATIEREVLYNRVRPSRLAWWILTAALAAAAVGWAADRRWLDRLALAGALAGFSVMTWGLAVRWLIAGRIPASNMYESLLFLGWGIGLIAVVALLAPRNRILIVNTSAMAALTMALTDLLPVDPFIHPMPPVLSGTPWLAIHVPIVMLSYSVLALAVLVAHMQVGALIFKRARADLVSRMGDLLYWYIQVGALLLVAGILTGSIWAASSWGRYWGWDPKEVWSLVAFLAYLAILHGRFDHLLGPFGVAAYSIVAFWTILMTYLGVNFVLTAGLHSYGFGGSGVVRWMALVAAVDALFLFVGWRAQASRPDSARRTPATESA